MKAGASSSRGAAILAPKKRTAMVWLEVPLTMAVALGVAFAVNPADPLFIGDPAQWAWFPVLLLALRHGALAGLCSTAILVGVWVVLNASNVATTVLPVRYFLGLTLLAVIAGEFSDIWQGRLHRSREIGHYLDQRLNALARRYFLLQRSSERLERELLIQPALLRSSLQQLREAMPGTVEPGQLPAADQLLQILAQSCQIEVAGLYPDINGKISEQPAATLGPCGPLLLRDRLVTYAIQHTRLAHVQSSTLRDIGSRYLVAAPVLNGEGRRLGLLVVERMPFLALNTECLQLLNADLSYYADLVLEQPRIGDLVALFPDCPPEFASELWRLHRIYRECQVESTLVALSFDDSRVGREKIFHEVTQHCRRLDSIWSICHDNNRILLTLMPLYDGKAVDGYLGRVEKHLRERLGIGSLTESGIQPRSVSIGSQSVEDTLTGLLRQCYGH